MVVKKGSRLVFVLLLLSSLLLLLSAFGVLPKPIRGAKRFQLDADTLPSESTPPGDETGEPADTSATIPPEETLPEDTETEEPDLSLIDLPVTGNDPDSLTPGGESLRLWPAEPALPILHTPDLKAYYGQAASSEPLRGITVILDAARGGADTGAVWGTGSDAILEKTLVLEIAEQAEKALTQLGATVVMTRTTDEEFSLFRTVAKAADVALIRYGDAAVDAGYKRDLVDNLRLLMSDIIRINQNSPASGGRGLFGSIGTPPQLRLLYDIEGQYSDTLFINIALGFDSGDSMTRGSQVYFMSADYTAEVNNGYAAGQDAQSLAPNYTDIDSSGRRRLAMLLKSALSGIEPFLAPEDDSYEGQERDMAVLRLTNYVSASFVPGYLSNDGDRRILTSEAGREAIGKAVANAVLQYYVTARPSG